MNNNKVEVLFVQVDDRGKLPTRNHENSGDEYFEIAGTHDSGYDIYGIENTIIPAHGSAVVPTGIKVGYITPGYWFKIESRSGLSFKHGILAHPGIIDNSYRGDTGVKLYNHSDKDYLVTAGERIAQMVIYPLVSSRLDWVAKAEETCRGESGFGSSGTH